tara:strand:+ start:527 stop:799 length:273 start_codon:yes stop_codon:yes gene_type:complete
MSFYRETGRPNASKVVNATAAGALITGVAGKSVVVYDVLTSAAISLTDGSNAVMYVQAGNCNLQSPINFGKGNGVTLVGTADVTITYDIV